MNSRLRVAALLLMIFVTANLLALSPEELQRSIATAEADQPESRAIDVDREGRALVSVHLANGREIYVRVSDARVIERERSLVIGEERRVLREIEEGAPYLTLPEAYRRLLNEMATSPESASMNPADFESIGYGRERGQSVIEVTFEAADWELELFLDPETAEILFSDWDD